MAESEHSLQIEGYRLLSRIGKGGMGEVFRAEQSDMGRIVAIKVLSPELSSQQRLIQRFEREALALAKLQHPSIVWIISRGKTTNGRYFFSMEFVEGRPLREIIERTLFAVAQTVPLVLDITETLAYAHSMNVIHRDIKPENILVKEGPGDRLQVKILDFGLAGLAQQEPDQFKLTSAGVTMGTPLYMSPEQRTNPGSVDAQTDVYSLGVVFYELLTGSIPMGICKPPSQINGDVPRLLDAIVSRMLEPDRNKRYRKMEDVAVDLRATRVGGICPVRDTIGPPPAAPLLTTRPLTTDRKRVVIEGLATPGLDVIVAGGCDEVKATVDSQGVFRVEVALKDGKNHLAAKVLQGGRESLASPTLEVLSRPQPPELVDVPERSSEENVSLRGRASPGDLVRLKIQERESEVKADDRGRFETVVRLDEGVNSLAAWVEADGVLSRESSVRIVRPLLVPRVDPLPTTTRQREISVEGCCVPSGIVTVLVRDRSFETGSDQSGRFALDLPLSMGKNPVRFKVTRDSVTSELSSPIVVSRSLPLASIVVAISVVLLSIASLSFWSTRGFGP